MMYYLSAHPTEPGKSRLPQFPGGGTLTAEVIEFDFNGGAIQSVQTCGEIKALVEAGKALIGVMSLGGGVTAQINVATAALTESGNTLFCYGVDGGTHQLSVMSFIAQTDSDVFTIST